MIDHMASVTAKLCSYARAYHSRNESSTIFNDYLAYDLMGRDEFSQIGDLVEHDFDVQHVADSGKDSRTRSSAAADAKAEDGPKSAGVNGNAKLRKNLNQYICPIPLFRGALIEEELARFVQQHGSCQYVICGAGLDTFAYRNHDKNITVYEIDHPDTQRYKLARIRKLGWKSVSEVHFVPVDFSKDSMAEKLLQAGFDRSKPAFFAIPGVSYYLQFSSFEQTLRAIGTIASPGSRLVFDYPDQVSLSSKASDRMQRLTKITASLGEPMLHGYTLRENTRALHESGFRIRRHYSPRSIQHYFFRKRNDGQKAYEGIHVIVAEKKRHAFSLPQLGGQGAGLQRHLPGSMA